MELEGLLQGANTLQVMVRDSADNEARLTLVFFVDTQPPQLLSVSPEDGSPVRDPSINLTGTMSEALSYLTVGGEAAEVDGANFSILLELDGDAKQYPLRAADELGNVVHITLRYILDQTPPFLEFPGLTYDEEEGTFGPKHTNQRSFMLLGNTELGATVYIDVWDYGVDERGRFGATLDLEEGTNVLPVLVRDLAGNELVTNVTLVLDTQSPELVVESPEHMHRTTNDYVWVEGTVTPGDLVIANEEVIVVDNGTFRFKVGLEEAVNRMVIIARDDAGNEVSVERLVFVVEDTEGLTGHPVLDSGCNSILVAVIIVAIVMAIIAGVSMKGVDVLDRRERQLEQVMEEEHIELDKPHLEPTTGQLEYDPTSPTGRAPGFEEAEDEEFISMSDFRREMEKRKG